MSESIIWDNPFFNDAQQTFLRVAEQIGTDENIIKRLKIPEKTLIVSVPYRMDDTHVEMAVGYRVQHNHALGPCKGGTRFHPNTSLGEVAALAMMMTWKSAIAGLPLGGAKGGVAIDPRPLSRAELQRVTRRYTLEILNAIGPESDIPAPDIGTNQQVMAWLMDTYSQHKGYTVPGVVTGKPIEVGGSLGRNEAPGRSVVDCIACLAPKLKIKLNSKASVVIQGFGQVGAAAFKKLASYGCRIIAVSDYSCGLYNAKGLDYKSLTKYVEKNGCLKGYPEADTISNKELLTLECTILIPAAVEHVIHHRNVKKLKCRILAEGANGPLTNLADKSLRGQDDIFVIPDILANAGGVIVSYFEWVQGLQSFFWKEEVVYKRLTEKMTESFENVYKMAQDENMDMRTAALATAIRKIEKTMLARGLYP